MLTTQRRSLMAQRVAQIGSVLRYYQDNTPLSKFLKLRSRGRFSLGHWAPVAFPPIRTGGCSGHLLSRKRTSFKFHLEYLTMAASAGSNQGAEADCWSRVPEKNFPTTASLKGSKPQRPGRRAFLCTLTSLSDASGAIWAWLRRMKESIIKVTAREATWSCNQTPGLGTHKLSSGNPTSCKSWNCMCWWVGCTARNSENLAPRGCRN